jgi:hypothetical protein
VLRKGNVGELALRLRRTQTTLEAHLAALEGLDHHDWLHGLSKATGVGLRELVDVLVEMWFAADPSLGEQVEAIRQVIEAK